MRDREKLLRIGLEAAWDEEESGASQYSGPLPGADIMWALESREKEVGHLLLRKCCQSMACK